jgi:hypothetical protein
MTPTAEGILASIAATAVFCHVKGRLLRNYIALVIFLVQINFTRQKLHYSTAGAPSKIWIAFYQVL